MPKLASTRPAYKMLTCIYLCRTLLFFAPYTNFYYKNDKKVLNKVLYNIKITIFVPEIKSESLFDRMILSMSN